MRASRDAGGSDLLQCSQVGLSSSIVIPLRWRPSRPFPSGRPSASTRLAVAVAHCRGLTRDRELDRAAKAAALVGFELVIGGARFVGGCHTAGPFRLANSGKLSGAVTDVSLFIPQSADLPSLSLSRK